MTNPISNAELEAFLDEALPSEAMAAIEDALRNDAALAARLAAAIGRRDAGVHALGAMWRRHRLTCPSREELGSYLLDVLDPAHADYVKFHLQTIGCRYCAANLADLRTQQAAEEPTDSQRRRHRYFQSSAGYLSRSR
jgi:hypothetical protein